MATYECLMPWCRAEVYRRGDCCEDCWADRRGQLDSLPDLYVMVYAMLTPGSRQQEIGTIHVPALDPAAPVNLVALDTLEYSYGRLCAWALFVSQTAGYGNPAVSRYTSGKGFLVAVRVLQECDHGLALKDCAGAYVLDVFTAYRRMVVQVVPNAPRHLDPPCPDCGVATLITRHADEYLMCLTCGSTWPHSQVPIITRRAQRTAR